MSPRAWLSVLVVIVLLSSSVGAYLILRDDDPPNDPDIDDEPPYVEPTGEVPFRGAGAFLPVDYAYFFTYELNEYTCYYTDDFFRWPSSMFDRSLLSATFCLATSTFGSPWYMPTPYHLAESFLTDIGFENVEANEDYKIQPQTHTIGAIAGMKRITCETENDTTLIALSLRGDGYGNEWASNFTVGYGTDSEDHHKGFFDSQTKVRDFLQSYIEEYDITGDVKLWITGYSRGAAVANVIAGRLDTAIANGEKPLGDDIDLTKHGLYCYTFATPTTIQHDDDSTIDPRSADYNNIKSVIMYGDVIPKLIFEGLGFERYGIDVTMSDPASENYEEDKVRAMGYYNEFSYQLDTDTYFLDGFTPYRIDLNALLTGGDLISLDPHAPYTDIDQALDVGFNEMSEIMEGRDWYVDNVEGLVIQIYDVICGDDYRYSLDTFINILVRLTMNRGDTHLVNMMMDVLMNKDISDYLIDDIELILTVLERDVAQAADIADGISDLALLFRGILFSGNSAILNALATIGMNMGFMTYGHIAHTYQSWIWVYDPIHDSE